MRIKRALRSWRRDLNPRPADYKSAALPTELRQPVGKTRNLAESFAIRNREFCVSDKIWADGCIGPDAGPRFPAYQPALRLKTSIQVGCGRWQHGHAAWGAEPARQFADHLPHHG